MSAPWYPERPPIGGGVLSPPDPPGYFRGVPLAPWHKRMAAALIDYAAPILLWPTVAIGIFGMSADAAALCAMAFIVYNSVGLNCVAQSWGKEAMGIQLAYPVLDPRTREVWLACAGPTRSLARFVAHVFDWFFFGWLRPVWNRRCQTLADSMAKTVVVAKYDDEGEAIELVWADEVNGRALLGRRSRLS